MITTLRPNQCGMLAAAAVRPWGVRVLAVRCDTRFLSCYIPIMQRLLPGIALIILLSGCGTTPINSETTRETVLEYVGTDVGTAGPFFKGGKKELDILPDADRRKAEALIDGGAALFLVYPANRTSDASTGSASRVVLVQHGKIVGDFAAVQKPAISTPPAASK